MQTPCVIELNCFLEVHSVSLFFQKSPAKLLPISFLISRLVSGIRNTMAAAWFLRQEMASFHNPKNSFVKNNAVKFKLLISWTFNKSCWSFFRSQQNTLSLSKDGWKGKRQKCAEKDRCWNNNIQALHGCEENTALRYLSSSVALWFFFIHKKAQFAFTPQHLSQSI